MRSLVSLLLIATPLLAAPVPRPVIDKRALTPEVAEAWRKAGAGVRWAAAYGPADLSVHFTYNLPPDSPDGLTDPVPLLYFFHPPTGGFAKLPAPTVPFRVVMSSWSESEAAEIKDLARFDQLVGVTVCYMKLPADEFKGLAGCKGLRVVECVSCPMTAAGLKGLSGCRTLTTLRLRETGLPDDGVKELKALPTLRTLELTNTRISDDGMNGLGALTNLESLTLDDGWNGPKVRHTDEGMKGVLKLKHLRELRLRADELTDATVKAVAEMKDLRVLQFRSNKVTGAGLRELAALTNLEHLELQSVAVPAGVFKSFTTLQTLGCSSAGDAALAELTELTELRELRLDSPWISAVGVKALAGCRKLETLSISNGHLDDEAVEWVANLDTLRELEVDAWSPKALTAEGLKELGRLSNLRSLKFGRVLVSDDTLAALVKLTELRHLTASGDGITDDGLKALAPLTQLRTLTLASPNVTGTGLTALSGCKRLTSLRLLGGPNAAGVKEVGRFTTLRQLELVNYRGMKAGDLAPLAHLSELRTLNLTSVSVTDRELTHVSGLPHLESVCLSGIGLTDDGLRALAGCKALRWVDAGYSDTATAKAFERFQADLPSCGQRHPFSKK